MAPTAASNLPLTYTPEPVSSAKRKFDQLNEELQIYSHSRKGDDILGEWSECEGV